MYHLAEVLITSRHELLSIHPSIHRVVSSRASNGFDTVEETPPHLHRAIHRPLLRGTVVLHLLHIDIHSCYTISTRQLELDVC